MNNDTTKIQNNPYFQKISLNKLPETEEVKTEIDFSDLLKSCKLDPEADLPPPPTAIEIHSIGKICPAFTLGNFSMMIAKAKQKKTSALTALGAAAASNDFALNNIRGTLPQDKRGVLWFDTEQSEYHATRTVKRILRQAGELKHFHAFGLRRFKPEEMMNARRPIPLVTFYDGLKGAGEK